MSIGLYLNNFERRISHMNSRPNEAQELYYTCNYLYGDVEEDDTTEDYGDDGDNLNHTKCTHRKRRISKAIAKKRFFRTATIANQNSRARLAHSDRHSGELIRKYATAKRLLATAQKMGMET